MKRRIMNREQYLILSKLRSLLRESREEENRLKKVNNDPKQQYDWDAWKEKSGYVNGLACGLAYLESFIKRWE